MGSRVGPVAAVYVANGFGGPSFLARLPERQHALGLSEGRLGLVVAGMALGAAGASPVAGRLVERVGSRTVVAVSAAVLGLTLWWVGAAPTALSLFGALVVVGAADAAMDTSMNANGALFEHRSGRSVMHRLHAAWSLGALAAAGVSSVAAGVGVPLTLQLTVLGAGIVGVGLMARRELVPGKLDHGAAAQVPAAEGDGNGNGAGPEPADRRRTARQRRWLGAVGLLAGATIAGAMVEGGPSDWAAVRIEQLGVASWVPALGFAAFMAGMLLGRSIGDHATDRFGGATVLRAGMALATFGFVLGIVVAHPASFMIGLALAGFGASAFFPLAFSAAAHTPGIAPGAGAAVVSLAARIGFLAEPLLIGAIAELAGLRWGFGLVAGAALALAITAPRIIPDRFTSPEPAPVSHL
jgi:MFS family permease